MSVNAKVTGGLNNLIAVNNMNKKEHFTSVRATCCTPFQGAAA